MNKRFKGKTVLVTGSSRGLGKVIALAFAKEGANIVLCCKENISLLKDVENTIKNLGVDALALKVDITKFEWVDGMIKTALATFDNIDVLINNAGNFDDSLVWRMARITWNNVIDVNLNGVFNCTRAVLDKARVSRIINIVSVQGQMGAAGAANYAAAKAGVIGFTKSVALELSKRNVTVNAVASGFISVGMIKRLPQKLQDVILSRIPMGRLGEPKEVASLVMFLASEEASYMTGQVIGVNGGYHM